MMMGPNVMGKVINVKIPIRRHVEQVLAVRRVVFVMKGGRLHKNEVGR